MVQWIRSIKIAVYADVETLRRQKGPSWIVLSHFGVGDMEPTRFFLHILREVGDLALIHNRLNNMLYRFEPRPSATVLPKARPSLLR